MPAYRVHDIKMPHYGTYAPETKDGDPAQWRWQDTGATPTITSTHTKPQRRRSREASASPSAMLFAVLEAGQTARKPSPRLDEHAACEEAARDDGCGGTDGRRPQHVPFVHLFFSFYSSHPLIFFRA